jgi:hypothetical protein
MKTKRLAVIGLVAGLLLALSNDALAFYNSSTGRWLSRDPLGEEAFFHGYLAQEPNAEKRLRLESLCPSYLFVNGDGVNHFDKTGLSGGADVRWSPNEDTCPAGTYITFAQVGYGGARLPGNYYDPFVDDGTKGLYGEPTGCLEYSNFQNPGHFEDSPGPGTAVGGVQFVTCQLCIKDCQCLVQTKPHASFKPGRQIVRVGPCKKWSFGFKGTLEDAPDATQAERQIWEDAIKKYNPKWQECYRCNSNQPSH